MITIKNTTDSSIKFKFTEHVTIEETDEYFKIYCRHSEYTIESNKQSDWSFAPYELSSVFYSEDEFTLVHITLPKNGFWEQE